MFLIAKNDTTGHAVRHVLLEKGVTCAFYSRQTDTLPAAYAHFNYTHDQYLIDHQLVIFDPQIALEYIDERYPAPALMPLDPVARAQARMLMRHLYRVCDDIRSHFAEAQNNSAHQHTLFDELRSANTLFKTQRFALGATISLVDLVLFECLDTIAKLYPDFLKSLPNLRAYLLDLRTRPSAVSYLASFSTRQKQNPKPCVPSSSPLYLCSSISG